MKPQTIDWNETTGYYSIIQVLIISYDNKIQLTQQARTKFTNFRPRMPCPSQLQGCRKIVNAISSELHRKLAMINGIANAGTGFLICTSNGCPFVAGNANMRAALFWKLKQGRYCMKSSRVYRSRWSWTLKLWSLWRKEEPPWKDYINSNWLHYLAHTFRERNQAVNWYDNDLQVLPLSLKTLRFLVATASFQYTLIFLAATTEAISCSLLC